MHCCGARERTACSCRLYFIQHCKNLVLLESSAPLSNQVEIGQRVQELLGSLTHVRTNTHGSGLQELVSQRKWAKIAYRRWAKPLERLGSCDFCTSDPCTVCPKHACSMLSLPATCSHGDSLWFTLVPSCFVIRIQASNVSEWHCLSELDAWFTLVLGAHVRTLWLMLPHRDGLDCSSEWDIVRNRSFLSVACSCWLAFEAEHGARLGDFNISIQNQTSWEKKLAWWQQQKLDYSTGLFHWYLLCVLLYFQCRDLKIALKMWIVPWFSS